MKQKTKLKCTTPQDSTDEGTGAHQELQRDYYTSTLLRHPAESAYGSHLGSVASYPESLLQGVGSGQRSVGGSLTVAVHLDYIGKALMFRDRILSALLNGVCAVSQDST